MAHEAGKGDKRVPMAITRGQFASNWELALGKRTGGKCPVCCENVSKCVCAPTDDGPGQPGADDQGGA